MTRLATAAARGGAAAGLGLTRHGAIGAVLGVLLLATLAGGLPRAHANGVPTVVKLGYVDGLSNWGPREALGTAELAFAEGIVNVEATGLPHLSGQRYQGWIVNSQSNDAISAGTFNADASQKVSYRGTLPPIANFGFDLFILTVEPDPDTAPQPAELRSIGGRFSLVVPNSADGQRISDTRTGVAPAALPNTGDADFTRDMTRLGVLVGAVLVSLVVATALSRRRA